MLDIKEIKEVQLSILKEVHKFCSENGIDYSLAHGTLLGAVRHKGFIPWDDDIDICLLEKDYEIFMKSFSHPYLRALCVETDPNWTYPYGKVYDNRTIVYEDADISYPQLGVNIDVFPIYNYPDNELQASILKFKIFFWSWIHNIKVTRISKERSFLKNSILSILKLLCVPFGFPFVNRRIREVCLKACPHKSKRVFETRSAQTAVYNAESFESFDKIEFEGNRYNVMIGWHDYLCTRHKDYMVLPPESSQHPHHNIKAFWRNEN